MLTHLTDSREFTFQFDLHSCMAKDHFADLIPGWPRKQFSCCKIMVHLTEDPWISSHGTADHYAIAACFFYQGFCFLWRIHITVSNDRDRYSFFDPVDRIPVRLTSIVLLSCPSMDCNCCRTGIFDDLCNLYRINRISFKSNTDLRCDRFLYCVRNFGHDLSDQIRVFEKCGTFAIIDYLRNRASHVDVQNVKRLLLNAFCNLCHQIRFASKNLHGNRMLCRIDLHERNCIFVMERNRLRADHLGTQKSCTLFFA